MKPAPKPDPGWNIVKQAVLQYACDHMRKFVNKHNDRLPHGAIIAVAQDIDINRQTLQEWARLGKCVAQGERNIRGLFRLATGSKIAADRLMLGI